MNQTEQAESLRCDVEPANLFELYEHYIHGYVSLLVCTIGAIGQIINLIIFTRKDMITPTNLVLAALALTDLTMLLINIPIHWYMTQLGYFAHRDQVNYGWAAAVFCHSYAFQVLHTISIWLTITLAMFRYLATEYPLSYRNWCNVALAQRIVAIGCVVCILQRMPFLYSTFGLHPANIMNEFHKCYIRNIPMGTNVALVMLKLNQSQKWVKHYYQFGCGVLLHLVPSVALTVLVFRLLYVLQKTANLKFSMHAKIVEENKKNRRTRMLLVVLFMFLLTEIPQGTLITLGYIYGSWFYCKYYWRLGNSIDLLVAVTSSLNSIVYYFMYERFRVSVKSLFGWKEKIGSADGTTCGTIPGPIRP